MTQKTRFFERQQKMKSTTVIFEGRQKKKLKTYLFEGQQKKKSAKKVVKLSKNIKQMDDNRAMAIYLKEEIIVNILSKLPVQSLLRLKCVSKFWKTLISDPYFKKKHLHHAKNNQNSQKFLVSQLCIGKDNMFSLYCCPLSSVQLADDTQKLDCPSNCKPLGQKIYCCYDGLSLIGVRNYSNRHLIILLWNPSTRESIVLPDPELPTKGSCTWGLGYDSTSDDYKILKIHHEVCSEILTLKSGSWRKIDRHPIDIYPELSGMDSLAFVHGAFHWLGRSLNYSVVSFSISNNVYVEIPLPEQMHLICKYIECGVSVLRGMLCCCSTNFYGKQEGTFKLWVMKDYAVKESWNLMVIFECTSLYSAIPKCRLADGELLLRSKFWKNAGSVFRTLEGPFGLWPLRDTLQEGFAYTESLISPKLLT